MKKGVIFTITALLVLTSLFATDKTLNFFKTNRQVFRFALSTVDSVKANSTTNQMLIYKKDGTKSAVNMTEIDSMNYTTGEYLLPTVQSQTIAYDYYLGKAVCIANISDDGGSNIMDRGICWSTKHNPTVLNIKSSNGTGAGQYYGIMTGLVTGITYYVRPYATNCMGTTYGEEKTVVYMPGYVYVSSAYTGSGVLDKSGTYFMGRSIESDHFILFWEPGFGNDPSAAATGYKTDVNLVLQRAEACYKMYTDSLKFVDKTSTKMNNYKMIILLKYTTDWVASGSGYDNTIGALNISPWAAPSRTGQTICHEIGHCFQYQVHCDLGDNSRGFMYGLGSGSGNVYWEMCANWQGYTVAPTETFSGDFFSGFTKNTFKSPFHEDTRYNNYFINFYWNYKHGNGNMVGRIWRESLNPEDPAQTYMRLNGLTLQQFNDEIWDMGARWATWDIPSLKTMGANYIGAISTTMKASTDAGYYKVDSAQCLQDHGINIIPLKISTKPATVKVTFQGLAGASGYRNVDNVSRAGWRYGFVALLSDGTRLYGQTGSDANGGTATLDIPATTSKLWLVVTSAPSTYKVHSWDDNAANDEQWPYQVKFENTSY
jgi:hypothetical protein